MFLKYFVSVYFSNLIDIDLQRFKIPLFDVPNNLLLLFPHNFLLKLAALENVSSLGPDGILLSDFLFKIRHIIYHSLWFIFKRTP